MKHLEFSTQRELNFDHIILMDWLIISEMMFLVLGHLPGQGCSSLVTVFGQTDSFRKILVRVGRYHSFRMWMIKILMIWYFSMIFFGPQTNIAFTIITTTCLLWHWKYSVTGSPRYFMNQIFYSSSLSKFSKKVIMVMSNLHGGKDAGWLKFSQGCWMHWARLQFCR